LDRLPRIETAGHGVPARGRAPGLLAATAFLPAFVALSLGACAAEQAGDGSGGGGVARQLLSLAFGDAPGPNPAGGPPIDGDTPSGSYLAGRFALESGEYGRAADSFDLALAADPASLELRRQVFLLRLANGDFDRALAAAAALVEVDARADEALLLLAVDRARGGA
jgi:tetratricopeptide (TPR) repeat protein